MRRTTHSYGLGVYKANEHIVLYYNSLSKKDNRLLIDSSTDGFTFSVFGGNNAILDQNRQAVDPRISGDLRIAQMNEKYLALYTYGLGAKQQTMVAKSYDLMEFTTLGPVSVSWNKEKSRPLNESGAIIPNYTYKGKHVMLYGEEKIRIAYSKDLLLWTGPARGLIEPREHGFDNGELVVGSVTVTPKGILVLYYVRALCGGVDCFSVGSVLLDNTNPEKILYRSDTAMLDHVEGFRGKTVYPIGLVPQDDSVISYWDVEGEGIVAISHPVELGKAKPGKKTIRLVLEKLKDNPILKPIAHHLWESKAVFNPAAIFENGKIHLLYRAVGDNDVSVIGYATTTDGVTIDERLDTPIYVPRADFEINRWNRGDTYNSPYMSGGAYGGCEDPRISRVDDKMYMLYVAYDGANPPRVALTSIPVTDFNNRNWDQWKEPVLISRPGVVDKNACVLSEKINGKYAVFHRIFPHILVDYVDSMEDFDGKNVFLKGEHAISPRPNYWDSRKIGIGAPPIKTDEGWLLIYQSVGDQDASRYKMGAMLLDPDEPHKVLFRSKTPILEPDRWYENEGMKFGVAYPCGAVIKDRTLHVYYGGADMVVCQAQADADEFIRDLKHREQAQLIPTMVRPR